MRAVLRHQPRAQAPTVGCPGRCCSLQLAPSVDHPPALPCAPDKLFVLVFWILHDQAEQNAAGIKRSTCNEPRSLLERETPGEKRAETGRRIVRLLRAEVERATDPELSEYETASRIKWKRVDSAKDARTGPTGGSGRPLPCEDTPRAGRRGEAGRSPSTRRKTEG